MRRLPHIVWPALLVTIVGGCASRPAYTQAQLNAIETRVVDAGFDETFDAASGALFDLGYMIFMSDRQGGLITGTQTKPARWGSRPYDSLLAVSIQVRAQDQARCTARIKTSVNGETRVDKDAIDEIWVLMQRQVLMHLPPDHAAPAAAQAP